MDSLTTISVEPHWCPLHQFILLTQGPIPEIFMKKYWELTVLKNSVFLSRYFEDNDPGLQPMRSWANTYAQNCIIFIDAANWNCMQGVPATTFDVGFLYMQKCTTKGVWPQFMQVIIILYQMSWSVSKRCLEQAFDMLDHITIQQAWMNHYSYQVEFSSLKYKKGVPKYRKMALYKNTF